MKRKIFAITSILFIFALVIWVQPVQSFALEVLSIFRVNEIKTLKITVTDLQEGIENIKRLKDESSDLEMSHISPVNIVSEEKSEVKTLDDVNEFTAFSFKLPRELKDQTPQLSAIDSSTVNFTLNIPECNQILTNLKADKLLPDELDEVEMAMISPSSVLAKYEDVLFYATQKPSFEAPNDAKNQLWEVMTEIKLIPQNIRQQLMDMDIDSADIYLPVLVGLGREINLGSTTGYIYTMSDLNSFINSLPEEMTEDFAQKESEWDNGAVLIWTKNGVLYVLAGTKTDGELGAIARSVR